MSSEYTYTLSVNIKRYITFCDLKNGEIFTIQGIPGLGNIFTGFPIYMKIEENLARDIIYSDSRKFEVDDKVIKIKLDGLRPSK
jgi:hypothetical protein